MSIKFATINSEKKFPTYNIRCNRNNIRINDIVFLEVGENKFKTTQKIYCRVDKVNKQTIRVTDLKLEIINDKIHFYLNIFNPISKKFGNCYVYSRKIYLCDRDQFTFE